MDAQRLLDSRTYKMIAVHMKEPPEAGKMFPSLRTHKDVNEDMDDDTIFQRVAMSMSKFGR